MEGEEYLWMILDKKLTFDEHLAKTRHRVDVENMDGFLRKLKRGLPNIGPYRNSPI